MSITGLQLRQQIARKRKQNGKPLLCFLGKTTAAGDSSGTYLTDTVRLKSATIGPDYFGDAYVRISDGSDAGYVAKVDYVDAANGRLYLVSNSYGSAIDTASQYEVWMRGISPDDVDQARDYALTRMCSDWWLRPVSVLADVADWATGAYSATTGGDSNATAAASTLGFPTEFFQSGMLVTNSGANGYVSSEVFYVQPNEQYRVWGWVSVQAETGSVRLRDLENGADIDTGGTDTFTLRGWQMFDLLYTIPSGCSPVQLWLGGASASCITEWTGVGMLSTRTKDVILPSRVRSKADIGHVYAYQTGNTLGSAYERNRVEIPREIERAGTLLRMWSDIPFAGEYPAYYQDRHFYTALQSNYYAVSDRTTGDAATTTCDIDYLEAATVVQLLRGSEDPALKVCYLEAQAELAAHERGVGPPPLVPAKVPRGRPRVRRL